MRKNIPNFFSLINLFCGCTAIPALCSGNRTLFFALMLVALVADFLDGFAARTLNAKSAVGKELDSLSDMVSFCVVPGLVMYILLYPALYKDAHFPEFGWGSLALLGFIYTLVAAIRLARFNVYQSTQSNFTGLASPAAAVYFFGLLLIADSGNGPVVKLVLNPAFLLTSIGVISLLLISGIKMFSLKGTGKSWKENKLVYAAIIVGLFNIAVFREIGFSLNILLYIIYNITDHFLSIHKH